MNLGRIGVVVKGCDAKAVAGLLREAQIDRDDVVLIGVRCGGVLEAAELPTAWRSSRDRAPRCFGCDNREPSLVDHLLGEPQPEPPRPAMTIEEASQRSTPSRLRSAGPSGAEVQQVRPLLRLPPGLPALRLRALRRRQDAAALDRGVLPPARQPLVEHHPSLHLAGRCVDCLQCERFCPVGIPLTLVNRKLQDS